MHKSTDVEMTIMGNLTLSAQATNHKLARGMKIFTKIEENGSYCRVLFGSGTESLMENRRESERENGKREENGKWRMGEKKRMGNREWEKRREWEREDGRREENGSYCRGLVVSGTESLMD